jgi:hypothetical protein
MSNHNLWLFSPWHPISQPWRKHRNRPHCYLNLGRLSVFFCNLLYLYSSRSCTVVGSSLFFCFILHYREGIRLFATLLLHPQGCTCGHLFLAQATKRRGIDRLCHFFPPLVTIVGPVLILLIVGFCFVMLFLTVAMPIFPLSYVCLYLYPEAV